MSTFSVDCTYREHASRLLCQDRCHVRYADVDVGQRCRRRDCFPTVDAVVRGCAYIQYVPAFDNEAAQSKGGSRAAAPCTAGHR